MEQTIVFTRGKLQPCQVVLICSIHGHELRLAGDGRLISFFKSRSLDATSASLLPIRNPILS